MLAFEVSGRISELPVKEGDVVKEGQVLARLDQRELKASWTRRWLTGRRRDPSGAGGQS